MISQNNSLIMLAMRLLKGVKDDSNARIGERKLNSETFDVTSTSIYNNVYMYIQLSNYALLLLYL